MTRRLNSHERHARLVKKVRRDYQEAHQGARLFPNNSGMAWAGHAVHGAGKVELLNPRPVYFGIPEPSRKRTEKKSGGGDLLGWTPFGITLPDKDGQERVFLKTSYPVFTTIECKTGNGRLMKNQKVFREIIKSVNGIWYLARECPECCHDWEAVWSGGKIIDWSVPACAACDGVGYRYEE